MNSFIRMSVLEPRYYVYAHVYYFYPDVPNAVTNVRIRDDITNESFVVLWDEVMDIFTITYNVTWYNDSGIIGMDTVNSPPYTVTGLTANTSYNVTVVAINTCGAGPVSDVPIEAVTNISVPTPLSPPASFTTPFSTSKSKPTADNVN